MPLFFLSIIFAFDAMKMPCRHYFIIRFLSRRHADAATPTPFAHYAISLLRHFSTCPSSAIIIDADCRYFADYCFSPFCLFSPFTPPPFLRFRHATPPCRHTQLIIFFHAIDYFFIFFFHFRHWLSLAISLFRFAVAISFSIDAFRNIDCHAMPLFRFHYCCLV
jgi:hypothetical protein